MYYIVGDHVSGNSKNGKGSTPRSPLGIISIFVFFIEAVASVSLKIVVETPYVAHLVWFIMLFPVLIVCLFFGTLWFKYQCLYSPMEYRDDQSFIDLLGKVNILEERAKVADIDTRTTEVSDVIPTLDKLVGLGDFSGVLNLGRHFLKNGFYRESEQIFTYLSERTPSEHSLKYKILANRAYSLIGLGSFDDAVVHLRKVQEIRPDKYKAWHAIALAYSYHMLGNDSKFEDYMRLAKEKPGFTRNIAFFKKLYPEIGEKLY